MPVRRIEREDAKVQGRKGRDGGKRIFLSCIPCVSAPWRLCAAFFHFDDRRMKNAFKES
jgi:hypothetical protein